MSNEKTESPTQFRLREQRSKGNIPQRKNAIEAICILLSVAILAALAPSYSAATFALFDVAISSPTQSLTEGIKQTWRYAYPLACITLSFSMGAAALCLISTLLFNQFNVAPSALTPKFDKLNAIAGFKRILSKAMLYNALRLTIYFGATGYLLYFVVLTNIRNAPYAMFFDFNAIFSYFLRMLSHILLGILFILGTLAIFDWLIQNRLFLSQNKMTKDEVRREYRSQEGDPQIKSARKAIAHQDGHAPLAKEATHVIYSNELLVALIFKENSQMPPFMVARVKGPAVGRIKNLYKGLRIPTFHMPRLAADFFTWRNPVISFQPDQRKEWQKYLIYPKAIHRMTYIKLRSMGVRTKHRVWQAVVPTYVSRCTVAVLIATAGCAGPNSNIDSVTHQVATGERFLSVGEYTKGYDVLESVGRNNPDSANAALKVADTYFAHSAYLRAIAYYKHAIAKGNRTAGVLGVGRVMLATNQAAAAEQQFRATLSMHPYSPDALNGLGVALDMQGRHQEAQNQYHILLERYPINKNGHNNLALSYILSGRHREASSRLGELARSYLDDPVVRQNFAISQVLIGEHKAAENTFALDMGPKEVMHNVQTIQELSRTKVLNGN